MSWNDVDDKHKKKFDRKYVSCSEQYELDYLKQCIKEVFPGKYSDAAIDLALKHCCNTVPTPRPREDFIKCLMKRLG